jgi:hypothetical protein
MNELVYTQRISETANITITIDFNKTIFELKFRGYVKLGIVKHKVTRFMEYNMHISRATQPVS